MIKLLEKKEILTSIEGLEGELEEVLDDTESSKEKAKFDLAYLKDAANYFGKKVQDAAADTEVHFSN